MNWWDDPLLRDIELAKRLLALKRAGKIKNVWIDGGVIQIETSRRKKRMLPRRHLWSLTWHFRDSLSPNFPGTQQ